MKSQIFIACMLFVLSGTAQTNSFPASGSVGIGTLAPDLSSQLEMKSTSQGILVPRLTLVQRNAIVAPATGLLIFQTDKTPGFYYYTGTAWSAIGANTALSNLTSTSVNQNLIPSVDNKSSLGSTTRRWKSLYTSTDAYINGLTFGTGPSLFPYNSYNTAAGSGALGLNASGTNNTSAGYGTLANNSTGSFNTATGANALNANTSGGMNTSVGAEALKNNSTGNGNTATGFGSLNSNTTGENNTAGGLYALYNSNGNNNTALGYSSLYYNTTGEYNTSSGASALYNNTTGGENTAAGYKALFANTTGFRNLALGAYALNNNTTGLANVASGYGSLFYNTTGVSNVAYGNESLYNNSIGNDNSAFGEQSLKGNTSGNRNTAIGKLALYSSRTGNNNTAAGYHSLYSNTSGSNNTVAGYQSAYFNTTGSHNVSIGTSALFNNTSGRYNVAGGAGSMLGNTTGMRNTGVGHNALYLNRTGSYNTALGDSALGSSGNVNYYTAVGFMSGTTPGAAASNATAIGYGAIAGADNRVSIGNLSVTSIGGMVGWTSSSDGRIKKNIESNIPGLKFINLLKPVTFNYDLSKAWALLGITDNSEYAARFDIEKRRYSGFVVQDVEAAASQAGYDFSGIDKTGNVWGLRYAEFVVPLVKAVQELNAIMDAKDAKIAELSLTAGQVSELKKDVDELKAVIQKMMAEKIPCTSSK